MHPINTQSLLVQRLRCVVIALGSLLALPALAAAPGITGPVFNLQAAATRVSQPNGKSVYTWGYGCLGTQP